MVYSHENFTAVFEVVRQQSGDQQRCNISMLWQQRKRTEIGLSDYLCDTPVHEHVGRDGQQESQSPAPASVPIMYRSPSGTSLSSSFRMRSASSRASSRGTV